MEEFILFSKLHPKQAAEVSDLCETLQKIDDPYLSVTECVPEVETDGKNFFSSCHEKILFKSFV